MPLEDKSASRKSQSVVKSCDWHMSTYSVDVSCSWQDQGLGFHRRMLVKVHRHQVAAFVFHLRSSLSPSLKCFNGDREFWTQDLSNLVDFGKRANFSSINTSVDSWMMRLKVRRRENRLSEVGRLEGSDLIFGSEPMMPIFWTLISIRLLLSLSSTHSQHKFVAKHNGWNEK